MPLAKSRIPFNVQNPFRPKRPTTSKIIFLSCEGCVTEEEYFDRISKLFSAIKTKVQFISVAEDAVHTGLRSRTRDQVQLLSKARPKQLVERIDQFKREKESVYQFSEHPDDEFWIVTDVDRNWSSDMIDSKMGKTYLDEWKDAVKACQEKGYGYAVSNPFFEIWLLLHHDDPTEEDKSFAVTDEHPYKKTNHFRTRLRELGVPLKDKKHIYESNYNEQNVKEAMQRAAALHRDKDDFCPKYFATTVYLLLQKIAEMLPDFVQIANE